MFAGNDQRDQVLGQAADNWRMAGNPREELRVRQMLFQQGSVPDPVRYADLLFKVAPDRFVQAAAGNNQALRDATMNRAYQFGDAATALKIVALRGAKKSPVWRGAYTALTGVYFKDPEPAVLTAFNAALGARTVGEQIATKANRDQQLTGDVWFYYAARFGEFTNSDEYLGAELEGRPASGRAYVTLGDHYRESNAPAKALEEYARALQLDPSAADVHNRMAEIYAEQKRTNEALDHWRQALRLWGQMQDRRELEEFWTGVPSTIEHAGMAVRPEIDKLLRTYIRRNGAYRFEPLLAAIWKASASPAEAARWVSDLSSSAVEPSQFLASIVSEEIVGPAEREILFANMLEQARREAERRAGDARSDARWRLQDFQMRYLRSLLATKQYTEAAEVVRSIPQDMRESMRGSLIPVEIEIAAAMGRLDSVLGRQDISSEQLRQAAASLRQSGQVLPARRLLEELYTRELDANNLDVSNFLGLAEVKLESGDASAGVALLRRMALVAGEPFETLTPAAELLAKFGRKTEAIEFWEARVKAVPWDTDASVQLAQLKNDSVALRRLASDQQVRYESRAKAAGTTNATGLGSGELDLLASNTPISAAAAEKPYFYHARVKAAAQTNDSASRIRLLRGAVVIDPVPTAARVDLFRALFQANQFEQAVGIFRNQVPQEEMYSKSVARDLATAYRKLGQLDSARRFLLMLSNLDPTTNVKAEIAGIDADLKKLQENQRRMPRVHDNLDQTDRVRPRV